MATRSVAAAARVQSTSTRLAQLRERMERIRAGESSTPQDVQRAREMAREQQSATSRAYQRLLTAHAAALTRQRELAKLVSQAVPLPRPARDRQLQRENERLRSALVAMETYGSDGEIERPEDQRRRLWEALVAECRSPEWQSWAHAVCTVAQNLLPGVRGAALTLYDREGSPFPLAATDVWTSGVEEIHQMLGEGPALAAYASRQPVLVDDLTTAYDRWPGFVGAAAGLGLHGVWSFPVPLEGQNAGSLTCYRTDPSATSADSRDGELLAEVAARALLGDVDALLEEDNAGPDGYQNLHVAAGMLSVQLGITVDEAIVQIRARAFSSGVGLDRTAQSVVDGTFGE